MPTLYKRNCDGCENAYIGSGKNFCSHSCSNRKTGLGKKHSQKTKDKMSDSQKGEKGNNWGKHASLDTCKKMSESRTGKKLPWKPGRVQWNKGKTGVYSQETLEKIRMARSLQTFSIETREKMRQNHLGKKNRWWLGGRTSLGETIRRCMKNRIWREAVFKRDGYACLQCDAKNGQGKTVILNADHIKPFAKILSENSIISVETAMECEELWDISNGRTLCLDCHKETDTYGRPSQLGMMVLSTVI